MKASELRDKDVAGLNQELSELLKAQIWPAHAKSDATAAEHQPAEEGAS